VIVVVATINSSAWLNRNPGVGPLFTWPQDLLVLSLMSFAVGQWCSLLFRAGIVGLFVGIVLSLGTVVVASTLRFLGIPDLLGLYALSAILLWASWLRAPDWIAERNSVGRWARYVAWMAIPLVLYFVGIFAHRAYEIPDLANAATNVVGPGGVVIPGVIAKQHSAALAELQRGATTDELETARLYRNLAAELQDLPPPAFAGGAGMAGAMPTMGAAGSAGPPGEIMPPEPVELPAEFIQAKKEWDEKLALLVDRFVEISRRPSADFVPDPLRFMSPEEMSITGVFERAVFRDATSRDEAGEHERALERYLGLLRFARHFQQRGDLARIRQAAIVQGRAYEELLARAVRREESAESLLKLYEIVNQPPYSESPNEDIAWLRDYVLFKAVLDQRIVAHENSLLTSLELARLRLTSRWLPWEHARTERLWNYQTVFEQEGDSDASIVQTWRTNTLLGNWMRRPSRSYYLSITTLPDIQRSAFQLRLLLLAFKREHGELPDELYELQAAYPGKVPLQPGSNLPWLYRPHGLKPDEIGDMNDKRYSQPAIWSAIRVPETQTHEGRSFAIEPSDGEAR
jgi:hypothetical protein